MLDLMLSDVDVEVEVAFNVDVYVDADVDGRPSTAISRGREVALC